MRWWLLSFSDPIGFLGGCIVEAQCPEEAVVLADNLNLIPVSTFSEQVLAGVINLTDCTVPPDSYRYRALTAEEVMEAFDEASMDFLEYKSFVPAMMN